MKNLISILTLFVFFSCGNRAAETTNEAAYDMAPAAVTEEVKTSSDGFSGGDVSGAKEEPEDKTKADLTATSQKLIKTGFLTIEVENYKESRKKIKDLVIKSGGYLGNESETNETYRISNELTIRIPAKAFDQMMEGLMAEGIKTDSKRIEVQDVGEEYADLTARVEEKLRVIGEETEAAQGRVKYLESQVS
jgi:hypothetical protein